MVRFLAALTGIHSRDEQTVQATQDWERGRISSKELNERFRDDTNELVGLQNSCQLDFVTDGQLTMGWQDLLRPITTGVRGIRKGAMVRWFNTNTFYFTPIIERALQTDGNAITRRLDKKLLRDRTVTKVVLPDPLTFAELSDDKHYGGKEKLLFAYCDVLNKEISNLAKAGIKYVQFSAPSLVARFRTGPISRDYLGQVGEGLRSALKGTHVLSGYHTCLGDASPYLPQIFDALPTDDIGFDFTQTDPSGLPQGRKGIVAGVADARSSHLEEVEDIVRGAERLAEKTGSNRITLAPTCDLQFVPRIVADAKVKRLAAAKSRLRKS